MIEGGGYVMPQIQVTKEELRDWLHYSDLREAGKIEEANAFRKDRLKMEPWAAKVFKEKMGLEFLLNMGWNMEDVEAAYGKEWLVK
jgi:hypothetical protein